VTPVTAIGTGSAAATSVSVFEPAADGYAASLIGSAS
jgi:hypothetical protein